MQRCRKKRRRRLTEYYDDKKYNIAYERCIGVMAKLVQKYGVQVLEKEERKENVIHECKNSIKKEF